MVSPASSPILPPAPETSISGSRAVHMSDAARPKPAFGVRIADIAALKEDGSTVIGQRRVPTLPEFDSAFAAFAQGTLFQTESGLTAVEDLQPGDWVTTATGKAEQVTWIGSALFSPTDMGERLRLTRIMPDSFGVNRPDSFVSLGTAARVLHTPPNLRNSASTAQIMTPADQFADGVNVIEITPPTAIRLFHIGLRRHAALVAGGLEVESYHPDANALKTLSQTLGAVFLSLFPHVAQLSDFGPLKYLRAPDEGSQSAA